MGPNKERKNFSLNLAFRKNKSPKTSGFISNRGTSEFRKKFFPGVSKKEWNNYHWQLRKRFQEPNDLREFLNLSEPEDVALASPKRSFKLGITPYYASLIDRENLEDPIRRTVLPVTDELSASEGEYLDPLSEDSNSPVPGIIHRYPDRVLFLVTDYCPVYCRYCTRSRLVGGNSNFEINLSQWKIAIEYIAKTKRIRDVLISGGDPLIYSNDRLDWLLANLRQIPHLEIIRIGTKIPLVLPQRITSGLVRTLKKYHPLYVSIHAIHPNEITEEAAQACERLADAGIPMGSQTVLLKGINDKAEIIKCLMHQLLKIRVKPYYLLQCDPIVGSRHFRTPVETGINIISELRGHTSGYAVPHFIIDLPGGGGKVSLDPDYVYGMEGNNLLIKNFEGRKGFKYPAV